MQYIECITLNILLNNNDLFIYLKYNIITYEYMSYTAYMSNKTLINVLINIYIINWHYNTV